MVSACHGVKNNNNEMVLNVKIIKVHKDWMHRRRKMLATGEGCAQLLNIVYGNML